jgi:cyclopropane-fatty-acyl-phospholipid synthase
MRLAPALSSRWDRFLRERFRARLASLKGGLLRCRDPLGTYEVGDVAAGGRAVEIRIRDCAFYRRLAAGGSVAAAEAFIDGLWETDDLVAVVRLLVRNRDVLDGFEKGPARLAGALLRLAHAVRRNSRNGARRNIAAHYDLGNAFFQLFLSEDLMYSSALYANVEDTLEIASRRKLDTICRKLELKPSDRVIEIGTGWGGFAIHASRHYGCHVTTTTISAEQHAYAAERIVAAGLEDRITLLHADYRDVCGQYDKLVSIEMIEAVGAEFLDAYFAKLEGLLAPDGRALVQAITIEDHRYAQAVRTVDFIKRHVFPGSFIPSIEAIVASKARSTELALVHLEDFGGSYARTLAGWRERFHAARASARELGYDERFLRLWDFYLAYCEGGFRERAIGVAQLVFDKPGRAAARDSAVRI